MPFRRKVAIAVTAAPWCHERDPSCYSVTGVCMGCLRTFDLRKRIRLTQPSIGGKCLVMRARALETPPAGTRVYSADYFHSGDNTLH